MSVDEALRYVSGLLEPSAEEAFEQRMFADESVAAEVGSAMAIVDAIRALAAEGAIVPVVLARDLLGFSSVTEWHPIEGRIESDIRDERFIAAHVPVTTRASRVHVLFCTPEGTPYFKVNEAPFDPASGEVVVLCKAHVALATATLVVRVVDDDERVLGEVAIANRSRA